MKDRRKKAKKSPQGLKPLPPEGEARLQDQVAKVREALAAGEDLEEVKLEVTPESNDLLWDLHLIASLAEIRHDAIPPLLVALFGGASDKERKKALKRALHRQKTKGVTVPEDILPREEARPRPAAPSPAARAYVSPIFGNGQRYVILEGPKEFLGGGNVLVARLSDVAGFQECHLLSLKRKHREELWAHFREQGLHDVAEAPSSYAVCLLEDAFDLDQNSDAAASYAPLRTAIWQHWGLPQEADEPDRRLPPLNEPERNLYRERSRELARTELFQSWLPSMEEIAPWIKKVQEVEHSPLILAEHQQRARYEQIIEEAVQALYPPDTRDLWRRRLLEMAYFLDLHGRTEEARAAQAAGEDLEASKVSSLKGENPFLLGLVMFAVRLGLEHLKQTEGKAPSGLVTPSGEPFIIGG